MKMKSNNENLEKSKLDKLDKISSFKSWLNIDFLIGAFLSLLAVAVMTVSYTSSKTEAKVLSSFLTGLFGVSAIASFRRASEKSARLQD